MFANQWQICSLMATSVTAVPAVGHKDHLESEDHAGFLDLLVHQVLLDHHQRSTGTLLINASAINWIQNLPAEDYYMMDIVTNWYTGLFVGNEGGRAREAAKCAEHGGELVNIANEEMYNVLYVYIKHEWLGYTNRGRDYAKVRLGFSHKNGDLRNSSGGEIGYVKWYSGNPSSGSAVYWIVATKSTRKQSYIGLVTASSGYSSPVPLCRFRVSS